jgi:hypothetical protein
VISKSTSLGLLAGLTLTLSVPSLAADSIKINELVIAGQIPAAQRAALRPEHSVRVPWVQQVMRECWRASTRHSPKQWRIGRRFYSPWR